jgi:ribosomal protein S18 acetylase RimI-like enzyme
VAERGAEILGFVDAWLQQPTDLMHRPTMFCFIAEIAVAEGVRSQGVGARLMAAIEAWAREEGAEYMSLEYNGHNPRAGAFYTERMGYRIGSTTAIKRL